MELCTALVMMAGMSYAIVFSLADKGSHILVTSRGRFAAWRGAESFLQEEVRAFVNMKKSDGTVWSENGFKSFFRNGFGKRKR